MGGWRFTERERRGLCTLLPLLVLAGVVLWRAERPHFERGATLYADAMLEAADTRPPAVSRVPSWEAAPGAEESLPAEAFAFDPNTVSFHDLVRLGFTRNEALGIVKLRARGKVFEIREDFAACYTVSERMYRRLEPFIRIGERYRLKARPPRQSRRIGEDTLALQPFHIDTASVELLVRTGFSRRQAEVLCAYRTMRGGLRSMEEVAACYVVSPEMVERLRPLLRFTEAQDSGPIEINEADSAALRSVRGIGARTVGPIMEYRRQLGGFAHVGQLAEVPGVTEVNYRMIVQQIRCDSCKIQKIDINFAPAEVLAAHPYFPPRTLRRLLKERQLKGGWHTLEELVASHIFTEEQARWVAPYLIFR